MDHVDWFTFSKNLTGGIVLFLMGMKMLGDSLKLAAGNRIKGVLLACSSNRFVGLLTGTLICGISNSLTLVSVLLVGFVSADLMTFDQSIGILLGAGIGSTFIGHLVLFKATTYGLVLVTLGYTIQLLSPKPSPPPAPPADRLWRENSFSSLEDGDVSPIEHKERSRPLSNAASRHSMSSSTQTLSTASPAPSLATLAGPQAEKVVSKAVHVGGIVLGLGLIFFGSDLMGDATALLRVYQPFVHLLASLSSPVLGVCVSTFFTAVVQSSGASIGLLIGMAKQGILTLDAGIPLMLGANIGTCSTGLLAASSQSREAVRVAVALALLRVVGVIAMLPFLGMFQSFLERWSPAEQGADIARQVAHSHTLFNVLLALVCLPFTSSLSQLVKWLVPNQPDSDTHVI